MENPEVTREEVQQKPLARSLSVLVKILIGLMIVGILAFATVIFFLTGQINKAITPLQQVNSGLSTQVSQLLHPTPTIIPDPVTIIQEVKSLARLETIQYSVEKVITAEMNQGVFGALVGDRLLFVAHGYVIAGVDLSKMAEQDLWMRGEELHARLPQAEVFVATLNNEQSYVYDRDTGIFRKADQELETLARQAAEEEIQKAAMESGILEQAQTNAEAYLRSLLNSLGYPQVVFQD